MLLQGGQPFAGDFRRVVGHQDAVAFVFAPADAAAELVELGESEAIRALNQHYIGVGYINAYFHHRRSYQNVEFAVPEAAHGLVLVGGSHSSVEKRQAQLGKDFPGEPLIFLSSGFGGDSVGFVNQGVDDKSLPAVADVLLDEAIDRAAPFRVEPAGQDFLTAGGEFVKGGQVEVAVEGQGQGTGDGSGGHNQGMGIFLAFLAQGGTLHYAEAMLFIHYGQSQVGHFYAVLDQGVGADKQVKAARSGHGGQLAAGTDADAAGQQADGYRAAQGCTVGGGDVVFPGDVAHSAEEIGDGLEVLFGQDFGRHHNGALVAGGDNG